MKKNNWIKTGTFFGIITLCVRLAASPAWIEQYYSLGLFPLLRSVFDTFITSWFPIPLSFIFVPFLFFYIGKLVWDWSQSASKGKGIRAISGVLNFSGWVVGLFLLMWGFNYGRKSIESHIGLQPEGQSLSALQTIIKNEAATLSTLRDQISSADTTALSSQHFPADMEDQLRLALEQVLQYYNYPILGSVRGRVIKPKGILLRFSTAGIYFPWTAEGHIDAGLIHLQRPYVMAHEMAHGYGFGDEGSCSFWAYLSAFTVNDPSLIYAIRLAYWRSLATHWVRADNETYQAFRKQLNPGMIADLTAINENTDAYPDIFPRFRNAAYDTYLKAQGISEGIQNYGRVIDLVEAWRKSEGEDVLK